MGKIFYLIGKSATGKDSIMERLLADDSLGLHRIVQYATRPIRDGEEEGREYHFITPERSEELERDGLVIECRAYNTVHGIWKYMLVRDGQIDLSERDYIAVETIESYTKVRDFFGDSSVVPIYVFVETGERLERALRRERNHLNPKYAEMCRRFLADEQDFSDESLREAGLMDADGTVRNAFENVDREECIAEIRAFILKEKEQGQPG